MATPKNTTAAHPEKTLWFAEPDEYGFYRVVNSDSIVLAQHCVQEEAKLFAAAPDLRNACLAALSQLTEDRPEYLEQDIRQLRRALTRAKPTIGAPKRKIKERDSLFPDFPRDR